MMTNKRNNILFLHLAVILFGFSGVLSQTIKTPAIIIAGGRVICSVGLLLAIAILKKIQLKLSSKKDYMIAIFSGIAMAIHWTTFFQTIQFSSVAIGIITFSTFPLFLTFLEPLIFHEKFNIRNIVSSIIIIIGVIITIPEFSTDNQITLAICLGMISSFMYALMTLANRYLSRIYSEQIICIYEQVSATIVLLPAMFILKFQWNYKDVLSIVFIGVVCTAIAYSLYVKVQKNINAQTVGIVSGMETVYGILFALIFLGEIPSFREIIGGAIILLVVLFFPFLEQINIFFNLIVRKIANLDR